MKNFASSEIVECGLRFTGPLVAHTVEEAWKLLPETGEGWVSLTTEVKRYDAQRRSGWLQQAEIAEGARTVSLRQDGMVWKAWVWEEAEGEDHRRVTWRYVSSLPAPPGRETRMRYYTYWRLGEPADDIRAWEPVGSRFAAWED
jgi:hypothetical protein